MHEICNDDPNESFEEMQRKAYFSLNLDTILQKEFMNSFEKFKGNSRPIFPNVELIFMKKFSFLHNSRRFNIKPINSDTNCTKIFNKAIENPIKTHNTEHKKPDYKFGFSLINSNENNEIFVPNEISKFLTQNKHKNLCNNNFFELSEDDIENLSFSNTHTELPKIPKWVEEFIENIDNDKKHKTANKTQANLKNFKFCKSPCLIDYKQIDNEKREIFYSMGGLIKGYNVFFIKI